MHHLIDDLLTFAGVTNGSGRWYLWWSGFEPDLLQLAALGIIYKRLQCHADTCRRLGLHHVHGTPYVVCRRHHPDGGSPTAQQISALQHRARQGR